MSDKPDQTQARRGFLKKAVAGGSVIPFAPTWALGATATVGIAAVASEAGASTAVPMVGYVSLSQDEAAFVETLVTVMCPADEFTPNGVDCGLATYIDRQLAGDFGRGAKRYARGPWIQGRPQQGYQLPLTPEQYFKAGLAAANEACVAKHGKPFDQVTPAQASAFLDDLGASKVAGATPPLGPWFNELVYPLFAQACFADPIYGGNVGKVFWKMVGYPGLPATHTVDMVQFRGKPYPGSKDPKSIADFS
jgi:gluconate 2-dehydrogenase gamma chain